MSLQRLLAAELSTGGQFHVKVEAQVAGLPSDSFSSLTGSKVTKEKGSNSRQAFREGSLFAVLPERSLVLSDK